MARLISMLQGNRDWRKEKAAKYVFPALKERRIEKPQGGRRGVVNKTGI